MMAKTNEADVAQTENPERIFGDASYNDE